MVQQYAMTCLRAQISCCIFDFRATFTYDL